jgi:hypothetical protein
MGGYCVRCHHLIHAGLLVVRRDQNGDWRHYDPTGRELTDDDIASARSTYQALTTDRAPGDQIVPQATACTRRPPPAGSTAETHDAETLTQRPLTPSPGPSRYRRLPTTRPPPATGTRYPPRRLVRRDSRTGSTGNLADRPVRSADEPRSIIRSPESTSTTPTLSRIRGPGPHRHSRRGARRLVITYEADRRAGPGPP